MSKNIDNTSVDWIFVCKKFFFLFLSFMVVFVFFALPAFMLPFTKGLPVIQETSFAERVVYYSVALVFIHLALYLSAIDDSGKAMMKGLAGNIKGTIFIVVLFIYGNATWGLNTFGVLIKTFPNQLYENRVKVVAREGLDAAYVTRNQSMAFSFQGSTNQVSRLEISNTMFNYNRPNRHVGVHAGDSLVLKGKENFFGVYVEEITVYPYDKRAVPFTLNVAQGNYIFSLPALFILGLALFCYFTIVKPNMPLVRHNLIQYKQRENKD